jgi:hypothetical protein
MSEGSAGFQPAVPGILPGTFCRPNVRQRTTLSRHPHAAGRMPALPSAAPDCGLENAVCAAIFPTTTAMKKILRSVCALLTVPFLFTACETPGEGAKHGAMIGAGIGALSEGNIQGAAAGAAIGAAAGALAGKIAKDERRRRYYDDYPEDYYYNRGYQDRDGYWRPEQSSRRHDYPYGRPTARRDYVRSPYRPHHLIDTRGIPRGAKVLDPSCDRVFINP